MPDQAGRPTLQDWLSLAGAATSIGKAIKEDRIESEIPKAAAAIEAGEATDQYSPNAVSKAQEQVSKKMQLQSMVDTRKARDEATAVYSHLQSGGSLDEMDTISPAGMKQGLETWSLTKAYQDTITKDKAASTVPGNAGGGMAGLEVMGKVAGIEKSQHDQQVRAAYGMIASGTKARPQDISAAAWTEAQYQAARENSELTSLSLRNRVTQASLNNQQAMGIFAQGEQLLQSGHEEEAMAKYVKAAQLANNGLNISPSQGGKSLEVDDALTGKKFTIPTPSAEQARTMVKSMLDPEASIKGAAALAESDRKFNAEAWSKAQNVTLADGKEVTVVELRRNGQPEYRANDGTSDSWFPLPKEERARAEAVANLSQTMLLQEKIDRMATNQAKIDGRSDDPAYIEELRGWYSEQVYSGAFGKKQAGRPTAQDTADSGQEKKASPEKTPAPKPGTTQAHVQKIQAMVNPKDKLEYLKKLPIETQQAIKPYFIQAQPKTAMEDETAGGLNYN